MDAAIIIERTVKFKVGIIAAAIIVGASIFLFTWKKAGPNAEYVIPADSESIGPSPSPPIQPIDYQFTKSIVVNRRALSVDGGVFQDVPCSADRSKPIVFGNIRLDDTAAGNLICIDDYMGGIQVTYKTPSGENETKLLGTQDSDAGESWETRSWITRGSGTLAIHSIALSSVEDTEDGKLLDCRASHTFLTWDKNKKILVEKAASSEGKIEEFAPPIHVAAGCLSGDGKWKGKDQ